MIGHNESTNVKHFIINHYIIDFQNRHKMKQFIAFITKEFHHILRDRRTMLILIGMPIVQIILFGFAISTEVREVRTAVLVPSENQDISRMIERMDASEYFAVNHIVRTPSELNDLFSKNKVELAVSFSPEVNRYRFDSEKIQIIADATDPNLAVNRSSYAKAILARAYQELGAGSGVQTVANPVLTSPNSVSQVKIYSKLLYNPQMRSAYNFVPGVMGLILMLICAMMTSISIVREKETGTMEILLVSPMNPFAVIFSKAVPYMALSLLNLTTILLLSVYVLGVPVAGSLVALIGVSLLFIYVSLSLGLLISCLTSTQVAALLISTMVLMIPTILLSGIIFPIESMPAILQGISSIIPARWYISVVRKIMITGVPVSYVWQEIGILCLMAVALTGLTIKKFNHRLE